MDEHLRTKGLGSFTHSTSSQVGADMAGVGGMPDAGRVHGDDDDLPRRPPARRIR